MNKVYPVLLSAVIIISIQSCSKKTHPSPAAKNPAPAEVNSKPVAINPPAISSDTVQVVKKNDSLTVTKPVIKKKPKEAVPKVITVNDKYASRSVDGRYYYDLQGHRYWRNNKDGKYYLFDKSMLTDENFKKPE